MDSTKLSKDEISRRESQKEKQYEQIAKQVVNNRKRPDRDIQVEDGDNSKFLNHNLQLFNLPIVDMGNDKDVLQRVVEYFDICAKNDVKPSVTGMSLAFGIDRRRLWEYKEGVKGNNTKVSDILKKAAIFLESQMADYMQNGKLNPLVGFFFMKNNFGYTDKQEVVITPNQPLGSDAPQEQLQDQYGNTIVSDDFEDKTE